MHERLLLATLTAFAVFSGGTTLITACVVKPLCYRAPICDNWFLGWFLGWRALLLGKRAGRRQRS